MGTEVRAMAKRDRRAEIMQAAEKLFTRGRVHQLTLDDVVQEARVGKGRLLVSAIPLDKTDPVTRQLRVSLTNYAASKAFHPTTTLTPEQATALFATGNDKPAAPTRQFDPDLDDGSGNR